MHELNYILIGKKIRKRRQELNFTQEYVANLLDVNPSHVSNIECGRANPSLTALVHIANILHCSVDLFLESEYDFSQNHDNYNDKNDGERIVDDFVVKSSLNKRILSKLENRDDAFKKKILKIIDII